MNSVKYAIVYYNTIVKRDVIVYKSSNYDLVCKVYESRFMNDDFMTFRIVIKYEN